MTRHRLITAVAVLAALGAGAWGTVQHAGAVSSIAKFVFSPTPIAASGSLTSGTVSVTVTAEDSSNAGVSTVPVNLTLTTLGIHPTGASTGTATATGGGCTNAALSATPVQCTTNGSGQISITYTACTSSCAVSGRDVLTASDPNGSATKTDSYSFSGVTQYAWQNGGQFATSGSLGAGAQVMFTVTAEDSSGTGEAGVPIYLSMNPLTGSATAFDSSTNTAKALTTTPKTIYADSNGSVLVTYTAPNPLPNGGSVTITAQNTGTNPTISAATSYTFTPNTSIFNGQQALGYGPLGGDPHAASAGFGHQYVFWRGTDNGLWYAWYSNGWHGPGNLEAGSGNGALASDPHPVYTGNGTVDVFWKGADGNLWHVYEAGNGGFAAPASLGGGPINEPEPTSSGHGDVSVFWEGTDSNLWMAQYRPGHGWQVPVFLGSGPLNGTPHADAFNTDSYDVFWKGTDNGIWHTSSFNFGGWSGAQPIANTSPIGGDPIAISAAPGTTDIYWQGTGGNGLWHAWYNAGWHGPQGYATTMSSDPSPISPNSGQVDVFWRDAADIEHLVNGAATTLHETTATGQPSATSWGNSHEEVFWKGNDGNSSLYHDWEH